MACSCRRPWSTSLRSTLAIQARKTLVAIKLKAWRRELDPAPIFYRPVKSKACLCHRGGPLEDESASSQRSHQADVKHPAQLTTEKWLPAVHEQSSLVISRGWSTYAELADQNICQISSQPAQQKRRWSPQKLALHWRVFAQSLLKTRTALNYKEELV